MRNGSLNRFTRNGSTASSESGPPRLSSKTPVRGAAAGGRTGITPRFYPVARARACGRRLASTQTPTAGRLLCARSVVHLVQDLVRLVLVALQGGQQLVEQVLHLGLHVAVAGGLHHLDHLAVAVHHHLQEGPIEVAAGQLLELVHLVLLGLAL